jgi:YegS/Rv2252/BmrU family lipid kinase
MTTKKCLVVVNPRGGTKRGPAILAQVRPVFERAGWELAVRVSEYPGHPQELAATLVLDGCDSLCVIGGDGTIHEVVNGLMQRGQPARVPLGFIPAGSGNTLHQHLGCVDPADAARRIVAGGTCPLDAVRVTMGDQVVYCVDIIGWGGVADINRTAEGLRILGPSRYAVAALWHILHARRYRAKVILDGLAIDDEFLFVIACNTKFTGKGMKMAPRAEIGDGKLDVVLVRRATRLQLLKLFSKIYDGSHLSMDCVEYRQVRSIAIQSDARESLDLDGEMKGRTPFHAEVVPAAFRVFT